MASCVSGGFYDLARAGSARSPDNRFAALSVDPCRTSITTEHGKAWLLLPKLLLVVVIVTLASIAGYLFFAEL